MTFLDQLQQSAGLLSNDIASVSTYIPQSSDFIGGVPQNRFVGNQFQMPGLQLAPGQQIPVFGGTMGSGMNFGTYTPEDFQSNFMQNIPTMQTTDRPQGGGGSGNFRDRGQIQTGGTLRYQNRDFNNLLGGDFEGRNVGDRFTFSRDLDFGQAFDEFGRRRNIGPTAQGLLQEVGNFLSGGGIVGNTVRSLLGMETPQQTQTLDFGQMPTQTSSPETLQALQQRAEEANLAEQASQARQELANMSGSKRLRDERDRDERNRARGFSGRGTSDPGGQAARGV
tara:strand:- start:43 stop:885 length:843 start_codon:yes stop_codon:yes gene_type:complete